LTFALRGCGILGRFRRAGGKLLYMSNVDNLGATLDPALVGAHIASGAKVTAEVIAETKGPKVIAFRFKRRKNVRRKRGHRERYTQVKITGITA